MHLYDIIGRMDFDPVKSGVVTVQFRTNLLFTANQVQTLYIRQPLQGLERSGNYFAGGMVAPHGIHGNMHGSSLVLFAGVDRQHLASGIVAALRANPVRLCRGTALRTGPRGNHFTGMRSLPHPFFTFRLFSFWNRHTNDLLCI
jgi:hypothetical protein